MASLNDEVDQETAVLVSEEFGFEVKFEDCLLYTSPSPRDVGISRMPSSA